jgi:hypothetical protein
MGREATCLCRACSHTEPVRALLESAELRLRGATLKRRLAISSVAAPQVVGDDLVFRAEGEDWRLALGQAEAQKWLQKLTTPPPSLAAKLGISAAKPAWVAGPVEDEALAAALQGATTPDPAAAHVLLAVVANEASLERALALHGSMPCAAVWLVYRKGPAAVPGDTAIRALLRSRGYMDHKSCAVSEAWTATRYARAA